MNQAEIKNVNHNKNVKAFKREKKSHIVHLMTIRKWHWMSSAICFACMLLFAITGVTLNHAADIEAKPEVTKISGQLPGALLLDIKQIENQKAKAISVAIKNWFAEKNIFIRDAQPELSDGEIYIPMIRPGGDAWLAISETGEFDYESTDRGWIAYFNDLHKGRNTGKAWVYFMDLFALACVVFSVTGLLLLQRYADTRAQTWPLVATGALLPLLLMVFLIH